MDIELRELDAADVPVIAAARAGAAWNGGLDKWRQRLADHVNGHRVVLLAVGRAGVLGYGSLLWTSQYPRFRDAAIPEIQDLVVAEQCRQRGIATRLIHALEERARAAGYTRIGLGVGLYSDYGSAQRLYVRLGYKLDGHGVTYHNAPVAGGSQVRLDDDLLLWMVKPLIEEQAARAG